MSIEPGSLAGRDFLLYRAAFDFLVAYRNARAADEEGMATVDTWRAAWAKCDRAADGLEAIIDARPCYICGRYTLRSDGFWNNEGKVWCLEHRPVWSRQ